MKDMSIPNSLVLDLGTANTKVGWSSHGEPESIFPTLVGRGRHKGAMKTLGLKDSYVGRQAQNLRGILNLSQPIKEGVVENWDDLETLWEYTWDKKGKNNDPAECRVLVSIPPLSTPKEWKSMAEILLEKTGIGGVYLANKSALAMYGGGRTTGVCVDSGEDMTYIVPCLEGSPIKDAMRVMKIGGKHVTDRMLALLSQGKYSFPDDTFLLLRRSAKSSQGSRFCVASRADVVREAKERFCCLAPKEKKEIVAEEQVLRLPDGNIVVVGDESHEAPEIMFRPELVGSKKNSSVVMDNNNSKQNGGDISTGLHELILESVQQCDENLRPKLLSNIVLTGGNSLLPALDKRIHEELKELVPNQSSLIRVQAQPGRETFTWDGGAHLCSLSSFEGLWLSKQDFKENGDVSNVDDNNKDN